VLPVLKNPRYAARVLSFSDDDAPASDAGTGSAAPVDAAPPEYTFEGYSIEVNQKITLTPIARHHRHSPKPSDAR
jgi:hypothetical protein